MRRETLAWRSNTATTGTSGPTTERTSSNRSPSGSSVPSASAAPWQDTKTPSTGSTDFRPASISARKLLEEILLDRAAGLRLRDAQRHRRPGAGAVHLGEEAGQVGQGDRGRGAAFGHDAVAADVDVGLEVFRGADRREAVALDGKSQNGDPRVVLGQRLLLSGGATGNASTRRLNVAACSKYGEWPESGINCASAQGSFAAMALARKGGKTTSWPPAISKRRHAEVLQVGKRAARGAAQAGAHLLLVERPRHLVDALVKKMQCRKALGRRRCPSPDGCRWRRPAAIFASASFSHASYCAPPDGSAPRRSIVPEVELSTSALTFAGWAMRVFEHRPAAHRLADQAHVGEAEMIDQRRKVAGIVGRIGAAGDRRRTARSRDGRRRRRCSAARSARPAATSSSGCRPAHGRTAAPGRWPVTS